MSAERISPLAAPKQRLASRLGNGVLSANALLIFALLYLPVIILVIFSFNNTRSIAVLTGFSLEWYSKLIQNVELLDAARNSLIVGLISTVVSTVIGTLTALGMERFSFRMRTAFDANLYLPIVIPEIVMGISLLLFFNQALFPFIEKLSGYRASTGLHTITVSHIAFNIPFVYVIVRARLADFDRTLEEAAQDLGANEWHTFLRVTLPLLMPGIVGGALLAFTLSLDDYLITVFTKGVQSQTMPIYIYSLVRRGVTPEINALSTVLLAGSISLVGLSLTAQGGGPLFTRAMSSGVAIGLAVFGLTRILGVVATGVFTPSSLVYILLLPLGAFWFWGSIKAWFEEFKEVNITGKILSIITIIILGLAGYFSLLIMTG
ncbi:MAG: ABC transporter permease [Anaerolineales bacterium]|nr:MAG: ABC transporter permease [Anaerolineales bacterium]